jgi:formylmethanofuran--tetrahydromethanopterin N-formyltransferase
VVAPQTGCPERLQLVGRRFFGKVKGPETGCCLVAAGEKFEPEGVAILTGLKVKGTRIEDTFAEAFGMRYTRLLVTAHDDYWLDAALREFCGDSASVIACDAEIGIERYLGDGEAPDGRPGASLLVFGFSQDALAKAIPRRTGQCLMTCPTTAVYDGLPDEEAKIPLGKHIRFFGDGYQKSKLLGSRRYWRIPVMDGEFLVSDQVGVAKGVAGGNIILQGVSAVTALEAARRASEHVRTLDDVIAPFPGGVARSGSKVGSRYKGLAASTADAYCPTLRGRVNSKLHPDANCAYEIVLDGTSEMAVARAMRGAIEAASGEGIVAISAGNYGGKLGKFHFHLTEIAQGL